MGVRSRHLGVGVHVQLCGGVMQRRPHFAILGIGAQRPLQQVGAVGCQSRLQRGQPHLLVGGQMAGVELQNVPSQGESSRILLFGE